MRRRDVIDAGQRADIGKGCQQVALGGDIGADIGERLDSKPDELALLVER